MSQRGANNPPKAPSLSSPPKRARLQTRLASRRCLFLFCANTMSSDSTRRSSTRTTTTSPSPPSSSSESLQLPRGRKRLRGAVDTASATSEAMSASNINNGDEEGERMDVVRQDDDDNDNDHQNNNNNSSTITTNEGGAVAEEDAHEEEESTPAILLSPSAAKAPPSRGGGGGEEGMGSTGSGNPQPPNGHDDSLHQSPRAASLPSSSLATAALSFHRLRLQAIFYPKFDNENSEQKVRHQMLERARHNPCYVEASVKHSGSLLLWSGASHFYSKNSVANSFSLAGHVLLKQHFLRMAAAVMMHTLSSSATEQQASVAASMEEPHMNQQLLERARQLYQACSDYVVQNRLTLSFEVMTSGPKVWGDHGQRPLHDYLVLTSIADRRNEAFHTTSQLLDVAHQFYLPHNDYFVFVGPKAAAALFDLYDSSAKSSGTATSVMAALERMATVHVPAMYPHATYQGEIMEGLVVRSVPFDEAKPPSIGSSTTLNPSETMGARDWQQSWQLRRERARDRLLLVEATPPVGSIVEQLLDSGRSVPPVYAASLRTMAAAAAAATTTESKPQALHESITRALCDVLELPAAAAATARVPKAQVNELNLAALLASLAQRGDDVETRRIATLLHTLCSSGSLRWGVELALFAATGEDSKVQYQLVVHVLHDTIFAKYEKMRAPGAMKLFRGFVINLMSDAGEANSPALHRQASLSTATTAMTLSDDVPIPGHVATPLDSAPDLPPLMLKLKFLPYMVRTFGIRNGLRTLKAKGPGGFLKYTGDLLRKWDMPVAAYETWQPYFKAWTLYVQNYVQRERRAEVVESSYLDHLEAFDQLYKSGSLPASVVPSSASTENSLRGLLVVAAIDEQTSRAVADALSRHLTGGAPAFDLAHVTPDQVWLSRDPGCGIIATARITQHLGAVRRLVNGQQQNRKSSLLVSSSVSIVLVGCSAQDVDVLESIDGKEKKKAVGMVTAWRKVECGNIFDVARSIVAEDGSISDNNSDLQQIVDYVRKAGDALPVADTRTGIVVFCPGIPGCGKSSLIVEETSQAIRSALKRLDADNPRRFVALTGDQVKEKYWPLVIRERLQDPSSVVFADKNAPLSSWGAVAGAAAKSKSVAVAVTYPSVLQTTTISGTRGADGAALGEQNHCYPFSLDFLALCLLRVLDRNAGQHEGKLDSGTNRACLIVVTFFGLYRGLVAEEFEHRMCTHFEEADAVLLRPSIPVPFFKSERPEIPRDLHGLLVEAVQANFGCEVARRDASKEPSAYLDSLEQRLRERLVSHRSLLLSLAVDEATSRNALASKLTEAVAEVDSRSTSETSGEPHRPFVTLAAIDVSYDSVQELALSTTSDVRFRSFWETVGLNRPSDVAVPLERPAPKSGQWTNKPHVTLVHFSHTDQRSLYDTFGPLEGGRVKVRPTAILWNRRVAALAVEVDTTLLPRDDTTEAGAATTTPGSTPPTPLPTHSIPPSRNPFVHVTIWCSDDASSVESNDLPALVESKQAERVDFDGPTEWVGVVRLWVR